MTSAVAGVRPVWSSAVRIARRCRAEVHTIEVPWGEVFTPDQVEDAIKRVRPPAPPCRATTSTTMLQPLAELGEICRRHDVLFYTDATASLGGNPLETDAWQRLDAVSAGMQKCLGGPSGASPITLSPRMEEVIRRRRCIEQDPHRCHHDGVDEMIYSNYFDLGMVMVQGPERLNHHTEATSALFAARCARLILGGLDNGIARRKLHGDALLKNIQAMGLETFGDLRHK